MAVSIAIIDHLQQQLDEKFSSDQIVPAGGSSLNDTYTLSGVHSQYFLKTNSTRFGDMLQAEFEGLLEIQKTETIRVPEPLASGCIDDTCFLVLEHLDIRPPSQQSQSTLGQQLAMMHKVSAPKFGWLRDNTIGLTPQPNKYNDDWVVFFREQRLQHQINLLAQQSGTDQLVSLVEKIIERLQHWFRSDLPPPALLHGDLWSGNQGMLKSGEPVIFDPAVYFGDAESDLAMTRLFGGFGASFYAAYREIRADTEYGPQRRDLYRLYHLLNHCNLFGSGYFAQTRNLANQLLSWAQDLT